MERTPMMAPAAADLSQAVQDYLKAIYLQTRGGAPTSTLALAEALAVRSPSVTNMLQKLAEADPLLIDYRKHYGVTLTPAGERAALAIIRRHRLLEQFLYQVLAYPLEQVHAEAEELEHAISPLFVERLAALLDEPAFDPHGDPIPDRDLVVRDRRDLVRLADLPPGASGIVRLISNQRPDLLAALRDLGLCPGVRLRVTQVNPIDGALQVAVSGAGVQALGRALAEAIQVEAV
jgi:DtxR family Mn-dependent transcriptional regulator